MKKAEATMQNRQAVPFDWDALRQRLDAVRTVIERAVAPDAEETARILRVRAGLLGRESKPAESDGADSIEIVEFILAQERYAFESRYVRDVHPLDQLTPIPCTPPFVLGIVSLRGEILSVIDIKKFFGLPEKGLTDLNKVIVLESSAMRFGVLADAMCGVRRIASADFQPSLPTLTDIRDDYLKGITRKRTVILDAERLLKDERIVVKEQVSAQV